MGLDEKNGTSLLRKEAAFFEPSTIAHYMQYYTSCSTVSRARIVQTLNCKVKSNTFQLTFHISGLTYMKPHMIKKKKIQASLRGKTRRDTFVFELRHDFGSGTADR